MVNGENFLRFKIKKGFAIKKDLMEFNVLFSVGDVRMDCGDQAYFWSAATKIRP